MTLTDARRAALSLIAAHQAPPRRRLINRRKRDGGEGRIVR